MRTAFDIVRAHYDASEHGDLAGMVADLAPDARWTEMAGFPCAGTYVGGDAVIEGVFKALGGMFDGFTFTLDRLIDGGDDVIGIGSYSGRSRATGRAFEARVAHIWHVADGRIVRFEQFADTLLVADAIR